MENRPRMTKLIVKPVCNVCMSQVNKSAAIVKQSLSVHIVHISFFFFVLLPFYRQSHSASSTSSSIFDDSD